MVAPGVRAFEHPPRASLEGFSFLADDVVAAEIVKQFAGLEAVVPGVQMYADLLREVEPEPGQLVQRRCQLR